LNIVSILYYYRKIIQKSKAFFSSARLSGKRINIILLAALIAAIALFAITRLTGKPVISRHIDISVSPEFESLFGVDLADALLKDFEKQRPDLRITKAATQPSLQGVEPQVRGSPLDKDAAILFFDDSEFGRLLNGSKLLALSSYIAAKTQAPAEHDAPSQDAQWALPLMSFMDLLFYNIDILQEANFDRPPKTRAEFLTAARTIARTREEQDEVYGFALDLAHGPRRDIYPWIWAAGGEICAGAAGEAPVLSRTAADTIAFFAQLRSEGLLSPVRDTGALEEFAQGKIAMITGSARDIAYLQGRSINFGITAIPGTTQGKNRLALSKIYAGISADCSLPKEAWAFLSYIEGKSQALAEALGAIPGSLPADFPGEYIVKDPLYSKAWDIFEAADIVDYLGGSPFDEEAEQLVMEKLRDSGFGE
jgi:multiple sugar transport system substrate-binding protein